MGKREQKGLDLYQERIFGPCCCAFRLFFCPEIPIATLELALLTDEYLYRTALWYVGLVNDTARSLSPHEFDLDIVKVRLQTTSQYKSALDGATQIFKNEGPLAFYKVSKLNRTQDHKNFADDL